MTWMDAPHSGTDSYDLGVPAALVIAETQHGGDAAAEALAAAGFELRGRLRFADAPRDMGNHEGLHLIVIEAGQAPDAMFDQVLTRAEAMASERSLSVIATVSPEQIDAASAQLTGPRTQLLCDPSPSERLSAMALARWQGSNRLHEASRDAETVRLRRLNEEVARIADTLARLTRGEEGERRAGVRDTGSGFRGEDEGTASETSAREVRAAIRARRMRAQFFEGELFADPAWDMLLDLFAAELERRRVSVSSLCIAAAVPPTTALRWIGTLHETGLFERQADPSDRRRAYIALSTRGLEGMRNYAGAVRRAGLTLV